MKKTLLTIAVCIISGLSGTAKDAYNGIIAYVDGGDTSYLLSESPKVTYSDNSAILTVNGVKVATVPLENGQELTITYGTYVPSAVNSVKAEPSKFVRNGKYITGGKLIIIGKDGKQYNAAGVQIKN